MRKVNIFLIKRFSGINFAISSVFIFRSYFFVVVCKVHSVYFLFSLINSILRFYLIFVNWNYCYIEQNRINLKLRKIRWYSTSLWKEENITVLDENRFFYLFFFSPNPVGKNPPTEVDGAADYGTRVPNAPENSSSSAKPSKVWKKISLDQKKYISHWSWNRIEGITSRRIFLLSTI